MKCRPTLPKGDHALNEKERLLNILRGNPVDRPAVICPGGMMNMVVCEAMDRTGVHWPEAHFSSEKMAALSKAVHDFGGIENVGVPFCMTVEAEGMGAKVYMGTRETEPRVIEYPMLQVEDWKNLTKLSEKESARLKAVLNAIRTLKEEQAETPVIGNLTGPISLAASLIEATVFYKALRRERKKAMAFLDFIVENLIWFGKEMVKAGADCINIADPSGTGEILGPKLFREVAIPYLNRLSEAIRAEGTCTIIHICGRLEDVLDQLDLLKTDAISVDSITSLKLVKENIAGKAVMGNVSTFTLEKGEADKVRKAGEAALKNGAHILAPACGLGPRTPLRNIAAMAAAAKRAN